MATPSSYPRKLLWSSGLPAKREPPRARKPAQRALEQAAGAIAAQLYGVRHTDPTRSLRAIRVIRMHLERAERFAVYTARSMDWSWEDIGGLLGLSRQAVHKRYAELSPRPRRRRSPA